MFNRRLKRRCLPDWIGISSADPDATTVDPVCTLDLKTECDSSNTLSVAGNSDKDSTDRPTDKKQSAKEGACYRNDSLDIDTNKKKTETKKPETKKRKPGINFLSASNSEKERNSRLFDECLALSLPLLVYKGSIIYSYNTNDCSFLCEDLTEKLNSSGDMFAGFDMEWPVLYEKGRGSGKVALIQLSISDETCYLFHLSAMEKFPERLKTLLQDKRLKKTGINIESDLWKLARDFDGIDAKATIDNSLVDLSKFANEKLKSSENWSLEGLCRHVLKMRLDKNQNVRCGSWQRYPLSEEQKLYAATDAYASLKIFNILSAATFSA